MWAAWRKKPACVVMQNSATVSLDDASVSSASRGGRGGRHGAFRIGLCSSWFVKRKPEKGNYRRGVKEGFGVLSDSGVGYSSMEFSKRSNSLSSRGLV